MDCYDFGLKRGKLVFGNFVKFGLKTGKGLKKRALHLTTNFEEYPPPGQLSDAKSGHYGTLLIGPL